MKKYNSLFYYVALANLMFFLGNSLYILLPIFLKQLGASESYIGFMHNADKLLVVITSIIIASFVRVQDKIRLLRIGYLILVFAFISYLFISSASWHILIIRIMHGIGFSVAMIFGSNIIFDIVPMKDAVEAIGIYGVTGAITNAVSPFIGELLISHGYSFYYIFAISAILLLLSLCITFIMPKPDRHADETSGEEKRGFFHIFRNARYTIITIAAIIFGGGFGTILTYLPNFILATTKFQFSYFFICYIAVLIIVRFKILGKLSAFNVNWLLIALFLLGVLMNVFLNFLYSMLILIGLAIIYGLIHGILYPLLNTISVSIVCAEDRNKANALFTASFNGGMFLFTLPFGYLIDYTGTYTAAFNASAVTFLIGIILLSINALKYGKINIVKDAPVVCE